MSAAGVPLNRTVVVLLASGLSRRFGWRDKLLEDLGGKPLFEHAAGVISGLDALARIAVCPGDKKDIGERLIDRFVIAVNKTPRSGLGNSIAVGVDVAMKFKPDAVLLCMADMPFIEPWMIEKVLSQLGGEFERRDRPFRRAGRRASADGVLVRVLQGSARPERRRWRQARHRAGWLQRSRRLDPGAVAGRRRYQGRARYWLASSSPIRRPSREATAE